MNNGLCSHAFSDSGISAKCDCPEGLEPGICATPCPEGEYVWIPANGTSDNLCGPYPIKSNADGSPDEEAVAAAIAAQSALDAPKSTNVGAIVGSILGVLALLLLALLYRRSVLNGQQAAIPASATLSNFTEGGRPTAGYLNPRYEAKPGGNGSATTNNVMYDNGDGSLFVVPSSPTVYTDASAAAKFRFDGAISNGVYDTTAADGGNQSRDHGALNNPTYTTPDDSASTAVLYSVANESYAGLGLRRHSSEALYDTAAELEALQATATYAEAAPGDQDANTVYDTAAATTAEGEPTYHEAGVFDGNHSRGNRVSVLIEDNDGLPARRQSSTESYLTIEGNGAGAVNYAMAAPTTENVYDAAAQEDAVQMRPRRSSSASSLNRRNSFV